MDLFRSERLPWKRSQWNVCVWMCVHVVHVGVCVVCGVCKCVFVCVCVRVGVRVRVVCAIWTKVFEPRFESVRTPPKNIVTMNR